MFQVQLPYIHHGKTYALPNSHKTVPIPIWMFSVERVLPIHRFMWPYHQKRIAGIVVLETVNSIIVSKFCSTAWIFSIIFCHAEFMRQRACLFIILVWT